MLRSPLGPSQPSRLARGKAFELSQMQADESPNLMFEHVLANMAVRNPRLGHVHELGALARVGNAVQHRHGPGEHESTWG